MFEIRMDPPEGDNYPDLRLARMMHRFSSFLR